MKRNTPLVISQVSQVTSTVEMIGPDLAAKYLSMNRPDNRNVKPRYIKKWVIAMKENRWELTHQGIAFDVEGFLIDGQHRLASIVASGVTVEMMVTRGLALKSFSTLDQGALRTAADILHRSQRFVGAMRCLIALEEYRLNSFRNTVSTADIEERMTSNYDAVTHLLQSIKTGRNNRPLFTSATIGALAYAYPIAPTLIEDFAEQLRSGELLSRDDPAYRLREWLGKRASRQGIDPWLAMMATLQAFHHLMLDTDHKIANLIVGESGYRLVTTQRRLQKIAHTPIAGVVTSLSPRLVKLA